jgi:23S rRNA pseudouridine1911/1915/1917 synthase
MNPTIYYCDRDLLVCEKPSGLLSEGESADALPSVLNEYLRSLGRKETVFCVHRLDRETSGLMVYALHRDAAASLSRQITEGGFEKEYLAVLCGAPTEKRGRFDDLLFFDRTKNRSYTVKRERKGVKAAALTYEVVEERDGYALTRVRLLTGRTHQIRVQFSSRGFPLQGDRRYGAPVGETRMRLHAFRLSFDHPKTRERQSFTSLPLWEEWTLETLKDL